MPTYHETNLADRLRDLTYSEMVSLESELHSRLRSEVAHVPRTGALCEALIGWARTIHHIETAQRKRREEQKGQKQ